MVSGKVRRLSRIFSEGGKTVIVPMDHGTTSGPIKGLEDMQKIIDLLKKTPTNAVVIHKGIAERVDTTGLGLIVHLSASTTLGPSPNWKVCVTSVEEAVRLGADAVSVHVNVGDEHEPDMLAKLGEVADECDAWGVPLLAMMYPRGPKIPSEHDPECVKHAARLGAELGADVVKTNYTGSVESFREVVRSCPVPVVIAGGPKAPTVEGFLRMVCDAMKAGAAGVSIGRNVFQAENPAKMATALSAIVHEGASAERALEILGGRDERTLD